MNVGVFLLALAIAVPVIPTICDIKAGRRTEYDLDWLPFSVICLLISVYARSAA